MKKYSEPNYKHAGRKVTKKQAGEMVKMRAKGKTWSEIATKYGVSPSTVKYNVDPDFRQAEILRTSM